MIPIAIMSKGRADNLETLKTLKEPLKNKDIFIFVEPDEAEYYKKHEKDNVKVFAFKEKSSSYGAAVNKVFSGMKEAGYQHFWLLDDDIQYFYRRNKFNEEKQYWHLEGIQGEDITDAFEEVEQKMLDDDYSQISFSYRQTNAFTVENWELNKNCSVAVLMNLKYADGHAPWCKVWGDIELSLRMISKGHPTCICYKYAFGYPGMGKEKGGLTAYYNSEKAQKETREILAKARKIYGDIVHPVKKKHHGGKLMELRVNWKKATKKQIFNKENSLEKFL